MFGKTISSTGFFAGALITTMVFLVLQLYAIHQSRTVAARVLATCTSSAQRGALPPGTLGVGALKDGHLTVIRGILPKLAAEQMDAGIHNLDSGVVIIHDQQVLYLSRDGAGNTLLQTFRVQQLASVLFYFIILVLTMLFYFFVFRTVRRLEGWIQGKSSKKGRQIRRISDRQLPMHGFTRIISGIEKIYSDLIHTEKEVERKTKLEALGVLFTKVLHDIKNSLASIKVYQYLLKTNHDETRRNELGKKVEDGMQEINMMVQDMLDFVRGSRNSLREHVRIKDLYSGLRTEYKAKAEMENVRFAITLDESISGRTIHVDMVRIVTALKHLVVNAFEEVTAAGGPDPTVEIRILDGGNGTRIEIADNGRGIPTRLQEKIFTPFVSDGKEDGNGIGTSVAKEYIEAQDGQIDFRTSENGTVFEVVLPFSNAAG